MVNPITHIVFAERLGGPLFARFDKAAFLAGVVFPRSCAAADAFCGAHPSIEGVCAGADAFLAGRKYAELTDAVWETRIVRCGVCHLLPPSALAVPALKAYGDEIFRGQLSDWSAVAHFFDVVRNEEAAASGDAASVQRWHAAVRAYLSAPVSDATRASFLGASGYSRAQTEEMNAIASRARARPEFAGMLRDMHASWDFLVRGAAR